MLAPLDRPRFFARANLVSLRGVVRCSPEFTFQVNSVGHAKISMAFNKSKALENALKFLNQGKVAQAIGEYQQVLRYDPKDQATLMTVGDLFARQGDMPQAVEYFERLAQVYLNDGFNSKAIAIYKKIAKLAPAELAPLERLADLYVQQGVLSEARPLFLQIAEAHLKANRSAKALDVLHRLLEIEPDNPRVQMRLAELYNAMGQKKEASHVYVAYAQRLFDQGEGAEAQKLLHRGLEADPNNPNALLLVARILGPQHSEKALPLLQRHPEADAGGEVTLLLVDFALHAGQIEEAVDRARNQLLRGSSHYALLHHVAHTLIESGQAADALPLLRELRDPMIEAVEQEKFLKSLSGAAERLPGNIEALEMLVDFCRHTSDPFRLNPALGQLADVYAAQGNDDRAEELLEELVDRNKGDERLVERLNKFRAGREPAPAPQPEEPVAPPPMAAAPEPQAQEPSEPVVEAEFDEETQAYIAQVLTDVDLFSSYGLTNKATQLLEKILVRAPLHTPTLERLLDFYLGAGDDRRTAEMAAQLEQIHRERNDTVNAERFASLRERFHKAAGLTEEDSHVAPAAPAEPKVAAPAPSAPPLAQESPAAAAPPEFQIPLATPSEPAAHEQHLAPAEVDLSDEWEAMVQEVAETEPAPAKEPPPPAAVADAVPDAIEVPQAAESAPDEVFEIVEEPAEESPQPLEAQTEVPANAAAHSEEMDLELTPQPPAAAQNSGAMASTDDLIGELIAEIEDMQAPEAEDAHAIIPGAIADAAPPPGSNGSSAYAQEAFHGNVDQLAEVFKEFRDELSEFGDKDEDLETHYNLGIAYREMGLLDEAIGEFQRVATSVEGGKPFPYTMNCSTLLALSFMDKGEPKIASLWYRRALALPGLDQATILALRYDLGVSLESAGDSSEALDSFRQVYAINIDYRDVADHIADLQKR
jgi:tetratricopeptide (TPR) repeat protein